MKAPLLLTLAALGFTQAANFNHSPRPHEKHVNDNKFLSEDENTHKHHGKHGEKDNHLYIHLIAHSHDDVGWLKTVDGYFSGTKVDIQDANVEMTLDTTIAELLKDTRRRYTQVEMKFFSMWWKDQTEETKAAVRALTNEGRLEFVNAGWSMHDEACTHYEDQINNMIIGHEFLM
jgi:Glycosyl hydrolases family 38 N-terminal domain